MLINKLKQKLANPFVRNVGWLSGAEFTNRILRLGSTVVVARILSPYDYGLIAIVLTTYDFATVFAIKSGIGSKLIQADKQDLEVLCDTAYWLNWIVCVLLFVVQCLIAFPIGWFYGNNQVILPICFIGLSYLTLPFFSIQSSLIQRENRLEVLALCNVAQTFFNSTITMILVLLGLRIWAIVIPFLLSTPIWIVITLRNHPWRPTAPFTLYRWKEIAGFSTNIIGVELLNKLRANLDYLLVGRFLGVEALGVYFFAFNAGLGISLNVLNSFSLSLFPHLCAVRDDFQQFRNRYFSSLKTMALVVVPLVLLQSGLAPFYVPFVFGQKWVTNGALPILILICLSAVPRPFADAASMLLQAVDKIQINLYWNLIFTVLFAICLLVAVNWGVIWVAAAVLISHAIALPLFTVWASRYVLAKR